MCSRSILVSAGEIGMAYRVVILAERELFASDAETIQAGVVFNYASSGYEAAAELLAEPADALVLDLTRLNKKHLKLLDIARQGGAELLGMGNGGFPEGFCADDLNGMRLGSAALVRKNVLALAGQKNAISHSVEPKVRLTAGKYASETQIKQGKELATGGGGEDS